MSRIKKKSLGETLKEARDLIPLTLRQVEDAIGISNAYLSQLENDKIKKPSANVLYKLASLYKVDLDVLLYACGLITDKQTVRSKLLAGIGILTTEEEQQLLDYLRYIRHKK
jgi:HTH-type transcriptional regulator, competence development regulator